MKTVEERRVDDLQKGDHILIDTRPRKAWVIKRGRKVELNYRRLRTKWGGQLKYHPMTDTFEVIKTPERML